METVNKLEQKAAERYKNLPHLSEATRKWIATNIWWITLVGVILGAIGVLAIVMATFFAGAALSVYGGVVGAAIGGLVLIAVLAFVGFMAVTVTLGAMAIGPLKAMRRRGWLLLFIALLVQVAESFVSFVFNWNLFGLIWSLFFAAVCGYFLFEIRDFYGTHTKLATGHEAKSSGASPKANTK